MNFYLHKLYYSILGFQDLVAGNYTFRLTVTDSDGESNSTVASVEVIKETDYPPEANAGAPVIIYLPQNQLTLNGNQSTDDHGITSWEWTLMNEGSVLGTNEAVKAVDMQVFSLSFITNKYNVVH